MISILILPEPRSINDIARLYNTNRLLHTQKNWLGKAKYAEGPIRKLIDGKPIRRILVLNPGPDLRGNPRVTLVPQMHQVCSQLILMLLRHPRYLGFDVF